MSGPLAFGSRLSPGTRPKRSKSGLELKTRKIRGMLYNFISFGTALRVFDIVADESRISSLQVLRAWCPAAA